MTAAVIMAAAILHHTTRLITQVAYMVAKSATTIKVSTMLAGWPE